MNVNDVSAKLNELMKLATGEEGSGTAVDSKDFINVASTTLSLGTDVIMNAVSDVLTKTIFSIRPYSRKFKGLEVTGDEWGNRVRKLAMGDIDFETNQEYSLTAGSSIDQYKFKKAPVIETNFYDSVAYMLQAPSILLNQINSAFTGPQQYTDFWSMINTTASNIIEQKHETMARACLGNFITGKISGDTSNVIHLITEYNAQTGLELDGTTVFDPANFKAFTQWVYSRIQNISDLMEERSINFHTNLTTTIKRHTPRADQRFYIYSPFLRQMEYMGLANTYNSSFLKLSYTESVNFWQEIDDPMTINMKPTYLQADGTTTQPSAEVNAKNVVGVIMDRQAAGYNVFNYSVNTTPLNASGKYYNMFYHFTDRYWNDFTENGVVLILD